jgi:3-deoxy-manno-octulosonate cytidylyltransferase (CMP-KDO synthetase)
MKKEVAILIPARYNSSRFPGKMLEEFHGKPLVRRVYDICASTGIDTYVLTDDERIASVVPNSIMTSSEYRNGTERCSSIVDALNYENFINVQGDMIDVNEEMIHIIEKNLVRGSLFGNEVITLYTKMNEKDQSDPNVVKLIHTNGSAHWFCRSSLKYGSRHIGVYGYSRYALKKYQELTSYTEEVIESLEQLRWIQNGGHISVYETPFDGIEINTPEDANLWRLLNGGKAETRV